MDYSAIVNMGVDDDEYSRVGGTELRGSPSNWEYPMERMVAVWSSPKILLDTRAP